MKWISTSTAQWAAVFVFVISSATTVEAQKPVAANLAKNLQDKSKEAVDARGEDVQQHLVVERYLRTVIGKERKAHEKDAASTNKVTSPSAIERYLRTVIGKERKAHAKEIAALKMKVQSPTAVERHFRNVIAKERKAHAKEISALKNQLRKLEGNSTPNAKRSRTKSRSE